MLPAARATEERLAVTALKPPTRTVYSGYTGRVLVAQEALTPHFWARQMVGTVYFGPALDRLLGDHDALLVEAGPGQTLTAFARRHPAVRSGRSSVVAMLPAAGSQAAGSLAAESPAVGPAGRDSAAVLAVAARLWEEGHDIDRESLVPLWRAATGRTGTGRTATGRTATGRTATGRTVTGRTVNAQAGTGVMPVGGPAR